VSVSVSLHRQAKVDRAVVLVASCVVAADNAGGRFVQGSLRRAVRRLLPLALTFVSLVQPSAPALASGWHAISRRRETIDRGSPCLGRRPLFGSYGWPVKPFDRPHPVRGNFGDPRTSFIGDLRGGPGAPGVFLFHNGVDISAPDGTAVYPVTGGRVIDVEPDNITIAADDDRHFQYWHIKPNVVTGEAVTPDRTILGRILARLGHVHVTEIDRGHVVNPLLPGHLFPYEDSKPPRVDRMMVTERGRALFGPTVDGSITISAVAHDVPSIAPPGHWRSAIVSPATLSWWLTGPDGSVVRGPGTAFDVRHTLPPPRRFWEVYSAGTFQNFPVSARHHLTITGRYVFHLTDLDTEALANGAYMLTVRATDICGNAGTLRTTLQIANRPNE
jgi:hypothetical protein